MAENQKINTRYIVMVLLGVLFTWEFHEFFHWLTGELLGNPMAMTLNTAYPVSGSYLKSWHEHVVSAAGPVATLLEALVVFLWIKRNNNFLLFPILFTCFYSRLMAGVMNFINPNDEGRLSLALGTDVFFLSILVVGSLAYLMYKSMKTLGLKTSQVIVTVCWIILFSSVIILSDQFFRIQIL
jgi:hypothetical protein